MVSVLQVIGILVTCVDLSVSTGAPPPPGLVTVITPLGSLMGLESTVGNFKSYVFYGVPYAEPPERFKKPQPVKPWTEIKPTIAPGKICSQTMHQMVGSQLPSTDVSEDCLLCDIYVPRSLSDQNDKAVIIWFLAGRFLEGQTGLFPATDLALHGDVINVVVAYRLGVFGFLSTGDATIPGNFGLWDQKMAIEWVKANIKSFGGDPSRITLAGTEAGAVSANLQATSPLNIGNFQRLILHSNSANSKGIFWKDAPQYAERLANYICPADSGDVISLTSQEVYDCLVSKTDVELTSAAQTVLDSYYSKIFGYPLGPVIDNDFILNTTDIKTLIPVDVLVSVVENEHFLRLYERLAPLEGRYKFKTNENVPKAVLCEEFIPSIVNLFYQNISNKDGFINLICDQYTNNDQIEQSRNALRVLGDLFNYAPLTEVLQNHVTVNSGKRAHLCLFSSKSIFIDFTSSVQWLNGTTDSDEMSYLLAVKTYQNLDPAFVSAEAVTVADTMISYWSSFIKTGDPNGDQSLQNWPLYDSITQSYLQLMQSPKVGSHLFQDRVNFWLSKVPAFLQPTTTSQPTTTTKPTTTTPPATTTTKATTTTPAKTTTRKQLVVAKSTTTTTTGPVNSSSVNAIALIMTFYAFLSIFIVRYQY